MTIEAKVIADSISPAGIRLTTMQLRYPRFIHAEELTHRVLETQPEVVIYEVIPDGLMYDPNLSRNASSSRAIPVNRMIEDLRRDPAMPVFWGSNKPGMQAGEELTGLALADAKMHWLGAMEKMIQEAQWLVELGLHKQIANRILEPWAHINVVVTATDWSNFFALRAHKDAQPEIKELALAMLNAMAGSHPTHLKPGQWHLPYVTENDKDRICFDLSMGPDDHDNHIEMARKISVARCARVSYLTHDGRQTTVEEDVALFDRLVGSMPLHASPAEHQATPDIEHEHENGGFNGWGRPYLHGNLRGWIQYRKTLPGEFTPG